MDLQFQQIIQRRPFKSPPQSGPIQQFNRPPNAQQRPQFPPPAPRQQTIPHRGYQDGGQSQGFQQNRFQGRGNFRYQGNQQEFQTGNQPNYNQGYQQRNNVNQLEQQNFDNFGGDTFNQQERRGQRRYQEKTYENEGQSRFPKPQQQYDSQRSRVPYQQSFNKNQQSYSPHQERKYSPQQNVRGPPGGRSQYQKRTPNDIVQDNMNQFIASQFHTQNQQFRGRGRGRGSRGRQQTFGRGQNQHQRPFPSQLDKRQNKERLEKFKPQSVQKKVEKKQSFVKSDKESESRSISGQSEDEYSEDSYSQSRESGSYSEYSRSESEDHGSREQDEQENQEERSSVQQSEEVSEQEKAYVRQESASLGQDDISTAAINQMCSKQEFNQRLATFDYNNRQAEHSKLKLDTSRSFSIFEINKRTLKPDYLLALKRFKRSADRAEDQQQEDSKDFRRSVKALVKVMNHINREIIDADNMKQKDLAFPLPPGQPAFQFIHIYDFLWDRMREMIKDITRLSPKQKMTKQVITICQQIARFFILSINQGRKKYNSKLKFDERMNTESIIKVISDLMNSYRQSRMDLRNLIQNLSDQERQTLTVEQIQKLMESKKIYISPYEPELSAYSFLFSDDRKKQFYQILTVGFEDQQTQSDNPLLNSQEMQRALAVHKILNQRNIEKYFSQLQSQDTDYLFACMMLKHIQKMRKQTSQMLFKSHYFYKDQKTPVKCAMLAQTLRKTLRFSKKQTQQFNEFVESLGVKVEGKILIWRQGYLNEDHYVPPEYVFNNEKINRKDWIDTQCKKNIKNANKLSREQLIKSSWRKSNYRQEIITFYLGRQRGQRPMIPKILSLPKEIPVRQVEKESVQVSKEKQAEEAVIQKEKEAKNIAVLNEMRKGLQKKAKRTKFLQKLQSDILELYRHTDQAKIINRKKSLAIIDQWLMYYRDKMLRISFNIIENQSRKKNLMRNMLKEIKTFAGIKKKFNSHFNQTSYQFDSINTSNIKPERLQKGLMSGLLAKAQFKAKNISCNTFQEYLNQNQHSLYGMNLNFLLLSTCSNSPQNDKVLFDTIFYFIHQKQGNNSMKRKLISEAISSLRSKEKQVPHLRVYFEGQNIGLNIRLAKINEGKSKRKAMAENSHVIQHVFGCHSLILVRENSKYQATQIILQNLEEFVNNRSRIYQGMDEDEQRYKIQTLSKIQLPILVMNIWKKPLSQQNKGSNGLLRISKQKFGYLSNLNEVVVLQGSTETMDLPFILREQLKKQMFLVENYYESQERIRCTINGLEQREGVKFNLGRQLKEEREIFGHKSMKELLREIRVNSSVIEQKLDLSKEGSSRQMGKRMIFCYYQEYFNMCLEQIVQESSNCFKNSIYFKDWPKHLLLTQNLLSLKDFQKNTSQLTQLSPIQTHQLIANTLELQPNYNIIAQTYKQYEFTKRICEQLKMKFVGENIQPIQTQYLILDQDPINIFGIRKSPPQNQPSHSQKQHILHLTHFINTIAKYLNLFDPKKSFSDDKFQNLYTVFQQYGLTFKTYDLNKLYQNEKKQNKKVMNYQIQGDSLQFFSYVVGYLMDGCKDMNILLPSNFRFKIDIGQFFKRSMANYRNVLRLLDLRRKDILDELKGSQNKNISQLVIRELGYEERVNERVISQRMEKGRRMVINCDSEFEESNNEGSGIWSQRMDEGEKDKFMQTSQNGVISLKRKGPCNYQNKHHNESNVFSYSRMEQLNELKKKIKC